MRTAVRFAWVGAAMVAFGATAALAVTLNRPAHAPEALTIGTVPGCATATLAVTLATGTGDTQAYPLDFTNTSGQVCALSGYPSVAAYEARPDGNLQVGNAAGTDASVVVHRVLLSPGATAHSEVVVSSVARGAECLPVRVTGLRVVPPGASRPQYLRVRLTACSATGLKARTCLHVRPVQPGPGRLPPAVRPHNRRQPSAAHSASPRPQ